MFYTEYNWEIELSLINAPSALCGYYLSSGLPGACLATSNRVAGVNDLAK